ncbi:MAG TPA: hypothetical protein VLG12_00430, partial [Candidatus Saccharimonadales bacterium]|nr:hypothetical protein [Candidatus Saccharimonadales bacterium]
EVHGDIKKNDQGLRWITDPKGNHPPFVKIVPLNEIIAESFGMQVGAGKVKTMFNTLCAAFDSEMEILLRTSIEDIAKASTQKIAEGVQKVRAGDIVIRPGFDGEYGIVKIWHNQLGIDF